MKFPVHPIIKTPLFIWHSRHMCSSLLLQKFTYHPCVVIIFFKISTTDICKNLILSFTCFLPVIFNSSVKIHLVTVCVSEIRICHRVYAREVRISYFKVLWKIYPVLFSVNNPLAWCNIWVTKWMANNYFFCHKIVISGFHLLEAIVWEWILASESQIYRFYVKKIVICHPLCHNIQMWKLLVILAVIKIYARSDIFNPYLCFQQNINVCYHINQVKRRSGNLWNSRIGWNITYFRL